MALVSGIAGFPFRGFHGRLDRVDQRVDVAGRLAAGQRGLHRAAALMPEHDDEPRAKVLHRVFNAAQRVIIHEVARRAHNKQVADVLVEDDFRRRARIRAANDDGKRMLSLGSLRAARRGRFARLTVAFAKR